MSRRLTITGVKSAGASPMSAGSLCRGTQAWRLNVIRSCLARRCASSGLGRGKWRGGVFWMAGLASGGEVTRLQMATRPTGSAARLQKGNFMSRAFEKMWPRHTGRLCCSHSVAGARSLHSLCTDRACYGHGAGQGRAGGCRQWTEWWQGRLAGRLGQSRGSTDGNDFRLLVYRTGYRQWRNFWFWDGVHSPVRGASEEPGATPHVFPKPVGTDSGGGSPTKAFRNIFALTVTMRFAVVVDITYMTIDLLRILTFMSKLAPIVHKNTLIPNIHHTKWLKLRTDEFDVSQSTDSLKIEVVKW